MRAAPSKSTAASKPSSSKRNSNRRRSDSLSLLRAPASTSMMMRSVTARSPPLPISSVSRSSTALPVARSYSTQADVSASITRRPGAPRPRESPEWRGLLASLVLRRVSWAGLPESKREVDGLRFGAKAVTVHVRLEGPDDPRQPIRWGCCCCYFFFLGGHLPWAASRSRLAWRSSAALSIVMLSMVSALRKEALTTPSVT